MNFREESSETKFTSSSNIDKLANNYNTSKPTSVELTSNIQIEKMNSELITSIKTSKENQIDKINDRYPCCIVWTPLPLITWFLPFIGHMGICYSNGIIRDFAGPYLVTEDDMAFGRPTRYWQLDSQKIPYGDNKKEIWDRAVAEASDEYKKRMHNLFCDNCHSHVAYALNIINYDRCSNWNMVKLCFLMFIKGKFVSVGGFLKTWGPFIFLSMIALVIVFVSVFVR